MFALVTHTMHLSLPQTPHNLLLKAINFTLPQGWAGHYYKLKIVLDDMDSDDLRVHLS